MNITLNSLPKTAVNKKKRQGLGYGSGKGGHTSGRGQKGQKSRGKMPLLFEGTKQRKSLIRRTPFLRGKLRNKPLGKKPVILNLKDLTGFKDKEVVDTEALIKKGLIRAAEAVNSVKILGDGELVKKLIFKVRTSKSARRKIEKAGGKVETI